MTKKSDPSVPTSIKLFDPITFKVISPQSIDQVTIHAIAPDGLIITSPWPHTMNEPITISATVFQHQIKLTVRATVLNQTTILTPLDDGSTAHLQDLRHLIRKEQHIHLCAASSVEHSQKKNGFEEMALAIKTLPDTDWHEFQETHNFLGKAYSWPLLITGMTGGIQQAALINRRLAAAAEHFGIPMGVGSQRLAVENKKHEEIFKLKNHNPRLTLIGNIGIGQLRASDAVDLAKRCVDMIEADALAIHLNILQEFVQVEGDRSFRHALPAIEKITRDLSVPVIVKEVGVGLDTETIKNLYNCGVRIMDVGGSGGTSWAHIEGQRSRHPLIQRLGATFRDFGLPTAKALRDAKSFALPELSLIATGGMRDGITIAKAIYAGANMVGIGLPLFRAALESEEAVFQELESLTLEYKMTKLLTSGLLEYN